MNHYFKLSHIIAGCLAVLVGYTSSVAIIFQAIEVSGASQAQANSWMLALGLGMGLSGLVLSWRYRMPILTAWSTPGAALLVLSLDGVSLNEATAAFLFCGILLTLTGLTGWFERLSRLIPDAIANAMLAGILFRFGLNVFTEMQDQLSLVALMAAAYLIGRRLFPLYVIPATLLLGVLYCWVAGVFGDFGAFSFALATPVFTMPVFSVSAVIGIGLPLFLVTMTSQNMPGVIALRGMGYNVPVSASMTVTGITTLVLAPFGGFAFNLAAITAAIGAGPDADPDPASRYKAGIVAGLVYCLLGLLGATVVAIFLIAPVALVTTIAGLALLNTIGNSLSAALSDVRQRDSALVTFMTTVSGISFFSIGAPLWALIFGLITNLVLNHKFQSFQSGGRP